MIDATVIRAHQHAAGSTKGQETQALGRSVAGFSTKVHAKVDSHGYPLDFKLTGGEVHEMMIAKDLISFECDYLLADRGYDSDEFRLFLLEGGITPVIPGKCNRKKAVEYDSFIYKERNQVERFFNKIKHYRRIACRYDKSSLMFKGSLILVGIILWLKI